MLVETDTPEFTGMLASLLDDLAAGDFDDNPQIVSSIVAGDNMISDTVSIGNDNKTYILTRVESTKKRIEKKSPTFKVIKTSISKPRTMKSDIRASFGLMIANVCNSFDFNRLLRLFQTYCVPDVTVRMIKRHPVTNDLIAVDLVGPLMFANLVYSNLQICPDCVTKMMNSRLDSSGIVTSTLMHNMTRIYNISSIHEVLPNMVVATSTTPLSVESQELADRIAGQDIIQKFEELRKTLPLRKNPIKVIHKVKIAIITNEQKRMSAIKANLVVIENDYSKEEM